MSLPTVPEYEPSAVPTVDSHAVVVGGSIAGLLAARVLADAYERVTVLERDPLGQDGVARRGVPQADHVHVLLEAGRAVLDSLFPGVQDDIVSAGGTVIDAGTDLRYYDRGDYLADCTAPLPMCCGTRPLFEEVVCRQAASTDGVRLRSECHVSQYVTDGTTMAVEGVEFVNERGTDETVAADLVVDATGRNSRTHRWLDRDGLSSPPVETVDVDLAYGTVAVERPPDATSAVLCAPTPPDPRGGTALPIEDDRWLVTLFGMHGAHPPTDRDGFIAFAERLPVSELSELLETRVWCSTVSRYPFPSSQWRHYESLDRVPDGLVVTGDALASFNPIYGQGMSVAALDALQLHHVLLRGGNDIPRRFYDRAADHIKTVWRLAVGADFAFDATTGPKPPGTELFNRYTARLVETAHESPVVSTAFARVLRLEKPPTALLRPGVLARVLAPSALY